MRNRMKNFAKSACEKVQYDDMPMLVAEAGGELSQTSSRESSPASKRTRLASPTCSRFSSDQCQNQLLVQTNLAKTCTNFTSSSAHAEAQPVENDQSKIPQTAAGKGDTQSTKETSLDAEDPEALIAKLLTKLSPDRIKQFTSLVEAKLKCKIQPSSAEQAPADASISAPCIVTENETVKASSSDADSKLAKSEASSDFRSSDIKPAAEESDTDVLQKLRTYRRKARKVIDPALIEHVLDLSNRLGMVAIGETCINKYNTTGKTSCLTIDWQKLERRKKQREEQKAKVREHQENTAAPVANLEREADSSDDDTANAVDDHSAKEKFIEITENPRGGSISLKIKLSGWKNEKPIKPVEDTKTVLPPKKRIKSMPTAKTEAEVTDEKAVASEPTKTKQANKKRKLRLLMKKPTSKKRRHVYPWDKKRCKKGETRDKEPADTEIMASTLKENRADTEDWQPGTDSKRLESELAAVSASAESGHISKYRRASSSAGNRSTSGGNIKSSFAFTSPTRKKYLRAGSFW